MVYSKFWRIKLTDEAEDISNTILQEMDTALETLKITYEKVIGIGLGLPAVVDIPENTTVRLSRLSKWNNYPIAKEIFRHTGAKVYIRNDAHLISIAEHSLLQDGDNSLFIVHRSGIGMSAVIGNKIYEGLKGNSCYIGHTTLVIGGRKCDCGLHGCFETYCSKRAIVMDYHEQGGDLLSYKEIVERASGGDPLAISIFEKAGEYFGVAIANFIKSYEIYTVILGDTMCDEEHVFFRSIIQSVKDYLKNYTNQQLKIIPGKLMSENFGLGGCHFVLSRFFARPKLR